MNNKKKFKRIPLLTKPFIKKKPLKFTINDDIYYQKKINVVKGPIKIFFD